VEKGMLFVNQAHFCVVLKRILSVGKRVEFISDKMAYIILRGPWCDIVLNVHAPTQNKIDMKGIFCDELEHVFDKFYKCHMKFFLRDFSVKVERENIFKPTTGNECVHVICNDNGVRVVNFATSKNLTVKRKVQCSHIITFINLRVRLLMERLIV
jgi:hypothetical protein